MSENKLNDRKPELSLTILKAHLESLQKIAEGRSDCLGMKSALGGLSVELESGKVSEERMREIMAELVMFERVLRERLEREAREREKYETPLEKLGKTMTGEMQI